MGRSGGGRFNPDAKAERVDAFPVTSRDDCRPVSTAVQCAASTSAAPAAVARRFLEGHVDARFVAVRDVRASQFLTGLAAINSDGVVQALLAADEEEWQRVLAWVLVRQQELDDAVELRAEPPTARPHARGGNELRSMAAAAAVPPGGALHRSHRSSSRSKDPREAAGRAMHPGSHRSSTVSSNEASGHGSGPRLSRASLLSTPGATPLHHDRRMTSSTDLGSAVHRKASAATESESDSDAERAELGLPTKAQHNPHHGLAPWRAVFDEWVGLLRTDEFMRPALAAEHRAERGGHGRLAPLSAPTHLVLLEAFVQRVTQTLGPMESGGGGAGSPTAASGRFKPSVVPHVLTTAAAMFAFTEYLLPLLGKHADLARVALGELARSIYMHPARFLLKKLGVAVSSSPPEGRAQGTNSWQALGVEQSDAFVSATFVREWHRVVRVHRVLRAIHEKKSLVAERQERLLQKAVLKMVAQTAKRLLIGWRIYTARNKKLRQRYRGVFSGLSLTMFLRGQIRHWHSQARLILSRHREGPDAGASVLSVEIVERRRRIAQSHELTALIEQRRYKEHLIERAQKANREMKLRLSKLEANTHSARQLNVRLATTFEQCADCVAPPPDQLHPAHIMRSSSSMTLVSQLNAAAGGSSLFPHAAAAANANDGDGRDAGDVFGRPDDDDGERGTDFAEWQAQVLQWVVSMAARDSATAGPKLARQLHAAAVAQAGDALSRRLSSTRRASILGASGGFTVGLLHRGAHLLPLLRLLLTILSPPKAVLQNRAPRQQERVQRPVPPVADEEVFGTVVAAADDPDDEGEDEEGAASLSLMDAAPELLAPGKRQKSFAALAAKLTRLASTMSSEEVSLGGTNDTAGDKGELDRQNSLNNFRAFELAAKKTSSEVRATAADGRGSRTKAELAAARGAQRDVEEVVAQERLQQLKHLFRGLSECSDSLSFASFVLELANKLTRVTAVSPRAPRVLPSSLAVPLSRRGEQWRMMMLSFLFLSQFGHNAGAFRVLPQPRPQTTLFVDEGPNSPRGHLFGSMSQRRQTRHVSRGLSLRAFRSASFDEKGQNGGNQVAAMGSGSEMRVHWRERLTKRKVCGDDARALVAMQFHNVCISQIARSAFYCDDIIAEAQRVYHMYSAAHPTIANSKIITTDFLALKLRIIFGRDSSFWKPVTATRVISNAREMEEFLITIASLSGMSPYHLADRLVAVLDDTDLFFVALGSESLFDAFGAHLADLSVIFSLYAEGEPPDFVITLDGWTQLNRPLLDTQYSAAMAEQAFTVVVDRNRKSARAFRRDAESDDLLEASSTSGSTNRQERAPGDSHAEHAPEERSPGAADVRPLGIPGTLKELDTSTFARASAGASVTPPAASLPIGPAGLDMDGFCQALSVLITFKDPNPFVALDAKVGPFIDDVLVPMVGAKAKSQAKRLSLVESGPGAAAAQYYRHTARLNKK